MESGSSLVKAKNIILAALTTVFFSQGIQAQEGIENDSLKKTITKHKKLPEQFINVDVWQEQATDNPQNPNIINANGVPLGIGQSEECIECDEKGFSDEDFLNKKFDREEALKKYTEWADDDIRKGQLEMFKKLYGDSTTTPPIPNIVAVDEGADRLFYQIWKPTWFTRERQPGEEGSALYDSNGKKYSLIDYYDKKTGKKLGTFDPTGKQIKNPVASQQGS